MIRMGREAALQKIYDLTTHDTFRGFGGNQLCSPTELVDGQLPVDCQPTDTLGVMVEDGCPSDDSPGGGVGTVLSS